MNTAATFRTTSEINVKARVKALCFGDDERLINPGDLLLEMVNTEQGDRLGANQTRFEVYISGRDIEQLLGQVERAAYLWRQNDWLRETTSRVLTEQELKAREPIPIVPTKRPVVDYAMAKVLTERNMSEPVPKLFG
ncbi:hypothetical protein UFOVP1255_1 [uncultured Caudovirales phage]|uniref:Uncharacterized protein n=1 Tax=uncultured Caudovirales phage TaxID=2100421 RepID=A0A6J5RAL9_9CAUD|nr:hypothetical protein UFOVP973_21 [uncultured Caudovirales phage]CAB4194019.1 hypothetical protein UFOVP1255_1 [uncultured Caudovirales phage]CAB4216915.1 hypothetical protein UFOVP1496_22 [uncultured Caudovirales phage]